MDLKRANKGRKERKKEKRKSGWVVFMERDPFIGFFIFLLFVHSSLQFSLMGEWGSMHCSPTLHPPPSTPTPPAHSTNGDFVFVVNFLLGPLPHKTPLP